MARHLRSRPIEAHREQSDLTRLLEVEARLERMLQSARDEAARLWRGSVGGAPGERVRSDWVHGARRGVALGRCSSGTEPAPRSWRVPRGDLRS